MIMQMEFWHIEAILETIIVVVVNKYQWGKNESLQSVAQLSCPIFIIFMSLLFIPWLFAKDIIFFIICQVPGSSL